MSESVPHTVAQVVPTPPRPDFCLPGSVRFFRVHRQHERKLSCSSFLRFVHSGQGHLSQRIRFHIHEFQQELFTTAAMYCRILNDQPFHSCVFTRDLRLVSTLRSTKFTLASWAGVNWSSCCSLRIVVFCRISCSCVSSCCSLCASSSIRFQGRTKAPTETPWFRSRNNKLRHHARTCD